MAQPALTVYSVGASQSISGGRWAGGRVSGDVPLAAVGPAGDFGVASSALSGDVGLSQISVGGAGLAGVDQPPANAFTAVSQSNTLLDLDPRADGAYNPSAPARAPWEITGVGWSTVMDYWGGVYVPTIGTHGSIMGYGGAGHSAVNALMWWRFDVATGAWSRYGPGPIHSDALQTYSAGVSPDPAAFDHAWGDWDAASTVLPSGFRQTGRGRVVEGSHARNRIVFRPPAAAGNTLGQLIIGWRVTGAQDAVGAMAGSHVYDLDTHIWSRTANQRPGYGALCGSLVYHSSIDAATCNSANIPDGAADHIDVLDCSTMTWTRRTLTSGGRFYNADAVAFAWTDGSGELWHIHAQWSPVLDYRVFAVSATASKSGGAVSWTTLTVSASTLPQTGTAYTASTGVCTVSWVQAGDGNYYAVNRVNGSTSVWTLIPPASGLISDTWTITELTVATGSLAGKAFDYRSLFWLPTKGALFWLGGTATAPQPQLIRPPGL